jgi:glycosyltransferase involved in cell wall biosynthesis
MPEPVKLSFATMTIAVHTEDRQPAIANHEWKNIFETLFRQYPEHRFVFLSPARDAGELPLLPNVVVPSTFLTTSIPILKKWRQKMQLNGLLKQYAADIFVTNELYLRLDKSIRQVLLLTDEQVFKITGNRKKFPLNKPRIKNALERADQVLVVSSFAAKFLCSAILLREDKVTPCGLAAGSSLKPLTWEEKQEIKESITGGKEYFLYTGSISPGNHIITLLKAFSLFKKRQLSNLQLVLAGPILWPLGGFEEKLATYRYRSDVIVLEKADELLQAKLLGAAYACVNPSTSEGFSAFQLMALCCGIPVISSSQNSEPESEAVLRAGNNAEEIANQMKLLYKDENFRASLVVNAAMETEKYNPSAVAAHVWQAITGTVTIT